MKTTKIYDGALDNVKRLAKDSKDKSTQLQIISKAVLHYAESLGYLHTSSGIVTIGDTVKSGLDGAIFTIKYVSEDRVLFSDGTSTSKSSREVWMLEKVSDNDK
ncbi:MAG: hypothetical protein U9Q66_04405 [Patescibacteria group bacterium]|nr:hypothetical protein [Patescibacteria group bacterium]